MTPQRWQEITGIFHAALERDAAERDAFLEVACRHDPSLRSEVNSMLAAHRDAGSFGDKPLQLPVPDAKRLQPGALINSFRIEALIGAGGMGEVYRATDTRLGRSVAIKVLPDAMARDSERLARLAREARVLATLNHPHIAAIYGIEEAADMRALVLELVEGTTLADAINRRAFSIAEIVGIARQISEALEAAHEKGIVHRDLKPGNIAITQNLEVKVLDFGLAKAVSTSGLDLLESTEAAATREGTLVGTAAYMSPEQARGLTVDKRADIWAFGCVLYELLARTRAFPGKTTTDVFAAILEREPDWTKLPSATPAHIRRVLKRILRKDAAERLRDIGDARIELTSGAAAEPAAPAPSRVSRLVAVAVGAVLGAAALAVIVAWDRTTNDATGDRVLAPEFRQLTFRRGTIAMARFANDDKTIVYSAAWDGRGQETYTGTIDAPESRALDFPPGVLVAVSPKNELAVKIGCANDIMLGNCLGTLATVPLSGGAPRALAKDARFAEWSPTGELALVRALRDGDRLEFPVGRVVHEGGTLLFPRVDAEGGRMAIASAQAGSIVTLTQQRPRTSTHVSLLVVDREGKTRTIPGAWPWITGIAWSPSGDELWFSELRGRVGYVHAITMDGRQRQLLRALGSIRLHDVARDGSLLITQIAARIVTMIGLPGQEVERPYSWFDAGPISELSADGQWALFTESGEAVAGKPTIYLRPTDASTAPVRLGEGYGIALSSDAASVLSVQPGASGQRLAVMPTGAGELVVLPRGDIETYDTNYGSFFPGDRRILFHGRRRGEGLRTFVQDLPAGEPRAITPDLDNSNYGVISPDGQWVVGSTAEADGVRHMLYPVGGGDPRPIAGSRADEPPIQWSADGTELFVRTFRTVERGRRPAETSIFRLSLRTGARTLWRTIRVTDTAGGGFPSAVMVTPDGRTFTYNYTQALHDLYLVTGVK